MQVKARWFIFTLNNPKEEIEQIWTRFQKGGCKFLTGQTERGESGTPHFQFVAWFANQTRGSALKKMLPEAHFEICKGTPEQAVAYCTKEDTRIGDVFKFGEYPFKLNSKTDWETVKTAAQKGQLEEIPGKIYVTHYTNLRAIAKDHVKGITTDKCRGIWIVGAPGLGKTYWARFIFGRDNVYEKLCNKWWDGYRGQQIVVCDDIDKHADKLSHHLKLWADRYSFIAESKGSAVAPLYRAFVVTANYPISQLIKDDDIALEAVNRRFLQFTFKVCQITGERMLVDSKGTIFEPNILAALLRSDFGITE